MALSIAGSDSGGGAGIQADLATFAALGVHGTTAITCLTAQNPRGVRSIFPAAPAFVRDQMTAVFQEVPPLAVKTGMLYSAGLIRVVSQFLADLTGTSRPQLVVDPVMVATSGARLLKPDAIRDLQRRLLPLATLTTPNLDEAQLLTGRALKNPEDLRSAARQIHETYGCAVLVKGGHLRGYREALDIFFDGTEEWMLAAPFVRGVSTHGTGCTYSAAITAFLAHGMPVGRAVTQAKEFISNAIRESRPIGRHWVLNWAAAGRAVSPVDRRA
jgi:hydroxymethylpyrimidine/phosphomethylpyrimidine kinase